LKYFYSVIFTLLIFSLFSAAYPAQAKTSHKNSATLGRASWYEQGRMTASGERFQPMARTAAHRTLPFGTRLRVVNAATGASTIVRVNDRGPAAWTGRILDLSKGAAAAIGMVHQGSQLVQLERLN
jgi:rare lipoprotein A